MRKKEQPDSGMELIAALDQLEKTNDISKEVVLMRQRLHSLMLLRAR